MRNYRISKNSPTLNDELITKEQRKQTVQKSGRQFPNQQSIVNTTNKTNRNQVTWWKQQHLADVPANGRLAHGEAVYNDPLS